MVTQGAHRQRHVRARGMDEVQGRGVADHDAHPGPGPGADRARGRRRRGGRPAAHGAGRPTRYRTLSAGKYREGLLRGGLPPWPADHLVEIALLAPARPETPGDTVEQVTGHAARALDDFLAEHLDHVTGPVPAFAG